VRVLVTGGTGFIGSHLVQALRLAGHEVVLLVRDPGRIPTALGPLGVDGVAHVRGDVTDDASVSRALVSVDAVVHAAAAVSFEARRDAEMLESNVRGTSVVLEAASRVGVDPIVYLSSYFALLPAPGGTISADGPVGRLRGVYAASKAAAEAVARRSQQQGAPVVIVYPGSVLGPRDPRFGEAQHFVRSVLRSQVPLVPPGGLDIADVRDVAAAIAAIVDRRPGTTRYLMSGTFVSLRDLVAELRRITGRRLVRIPVPAWMGGLAGQAASAANRLTGLHLPISTGAAEAVAAVRPGDDSAAAADLGFTPRPLHDTLHDTVRWLHEAGRLTRRQAGRASDLMVQGRAAHGRT
jgi:dihydroflavonol-4-reductase